MAATVAAEKVRSTGAPYEFTPLGLDLESSSAAMAEGLDVLEKLWSGPDVSNQDGRWPFPAVTVTPQPVQQMTRRRAGLRRETDVLEGRHLRHQVGPLE